MRVTHKKSLTDDEDKNVKEVHKLFESKWGLKVDRDVIEDLLGILKDRECLKSSYEIWNETKKGYKRGDLDLIRSGYSRNVGMKRFLYELAEHPYYRELLHQPNPLLSISDMLGNLIEKMRQTTGGQSPDTESEEDRTFREVVEYGRTILDLLDDPSIQEFLQPQPSPDGKSPPSSPGDKPKEDKAQGFDYSKGVEQLLKWKAEDLRVLELCEEFDFVMRLTKTGLESPHPYPEDGIDIRMLQNINEITRVLPSQLALPSDIFYQKLGKRELLIKEWMTKKERKQILYILCDNSGSMSGEHISGVEKHIWASSVAISYLRKMVQNEDIFAFRFFSDDVKDLYIAENPKDAGALIRHILKNSSSGGGTDIQKAIYQAIYDIKAKKDRRIEEANILMITDGESSFDNKFVKDVRESKIHLHTVIIGRFNSRYHSPLKEVSRNFLHITNAQGMFQLAKMFNR